MYVVFCTTTKVVGVHRILGRWDEIGGGGR
jgi:hypothetical protein